jgi:N-acetylmuramoyl-L-alanine amidase
MIKPLLLFVLCIAFQFCSTSGEKLAPADQPNQASQPAPKSTRVICIDPGHPSETSAGNAIQNGTTEVHIVWTVALKLRELLEAKGISVVMTKDAEKQLVKNKDRAMIANDSSAALMVRLHCDASTDSGFALYAPDRQGTVHGVTGPSRDVMERSLSAAKAVHSGMVEALKGSLKDGGVRGDSQTYIGSRQGALTGSIYSKVPVVTIEMVVLSNKSDAEFIKSESGQQKMAEAIASGIELFLKKTANLR